MDPEHQLPAVDHLKVVVDALQATGLQLADITGQLASTCGHNIVGGILTGQVNGDIVGATKGEVALDNQLTANRD